MRCSQIPRNVVSTTSKASRVSKIMSRGKGNSSNTSIMASEVTISIFNNNSSKCRTFSRTQTSSNLTWTRSERFTAEARSGSFTFTTLLCSSASSSKMNSLNYPKNYMGLSKLRLWTVLRKRSSVRSFLSMTSHKFWFSQKIQKMTENATKAKMIWTILRMQLHAKCKISCKWWPQLISKILMREATKPKFYTSQTKRRPLPPWRL